MIPQTSNDGEDEEVGQHVVQGAADVEVVWEVVFLLAEEVD